MCINRSPACNTTTSPGLCTGAVSLFRQVRSKPFSGFTARQLRAKDRALGHNLKSVLVDPKQAGARLLPESRESAAAAAAEDKAATAAAAAHTPELEYARAINFATFAPYLRRNAELYRRWRATPGRSFHRTGYATRDELLTPHLPPSPLLTSLCPSRHRTRPELRAQLLHL